MLKNQNYHTPIIGMIKIGYTVPHGDGKRIPVRDDQFNITTRVKKDDKWKLHPLHNQLLDKIKLPKDVDQEEKKLRSIPIKLLFDNPQLNLSEHYEAWDIADGARACVGDGEKCKRRDTNTGSVSEAKCNGPEFCEYAKNKNVRCKRMTRFIAQIEGQTEELGVFMISTSGFNSTNTLSSKLLHLHSLHDGMLKGLPLKILLRAKTNTTNRNNPFYYIDIEYADGIDTVKAHTAAKSLHDKYATAGLQIAKAEEALMKLFSQNPLQVEIDFEEVEDFYSGSNGAAGASTKSQTIGASQLATILGNAAPGEANSAQRADSETGQLAAA